MKKILLFLIISINLQAQKINLSSIFELGYSDVYAKFVYKTTNLTDEIIVGGEQKRMAMLDAYGNYSALLGFNLDYQINHYFGISTAIESNFKTVRCIYSDNQFFLFAGNMSYLYINNKKQNVSIGGGFVFDYLITTNSQREFNEKTIKALSLKISYKISPHTYIYLDTQKSMSEFNAFNAPIMFDFEYKFYWYNINIGFKYNIF